MKLKIYIFLAIIAILFVFIYKTSTTSQTSLTPDLPTNPSDDISGLMVKAMSKKYNQPEEEYLIDTVKVEGNYAQGTVRFKSVMGGGIWFAAKTAQGWELAADGNALVDCEVIEKYQFPIEMIPGCVDNKNGGTFVKR